MIPEFKRRSTLPKLEVVDSIAPYLNLDSNRSESFNHTINAVKSLIE
jgi:hypothetical protein